MVGLDGHTDGFSGGGRVRLSGPVAQPPRQEPFCTCQAKMDPPDRGPMRAVIPVQEATLDGHQSAGQPGQARRRPCESLWLPTPSLLVYGGPLSSASAPMAGSIVYRGVRQG